MSFACASALLAVEPDDPAADRGAGPDVPHRSDAADQLLGRDGDDRLDGLAGGDCLYGDDGDDVLRGGNGDDNITGGAGRDLVDCGPGNDIAIVDEQDRGRNCERVSRR